MNTQSGKQPAEFISYYVCFGNISVSFIVRVSFETFTAFYLVVYVTKLTPSLERKSRSWQSGSLNSSTDFPPYMIWTSISQPFSHARIPKRNFRIARKTSENVYRPETKTRLVRHGYYSSIANEWTKFPAIFRWLFGIFGSNAKCLYSYYTTSLETPDDVFRNTMVPRTPVGKNCTSPFLMLPPTHFLVSHVVYSFQLQHFLIKLMQFPSSSFVLYVSPILGFMR
jgi:hypothetical protein